MNSKRIKCDIVVIGSSAGGLHATPQIIASLPRDFPACVAWVNHRGPNLVDDWIGLFLGDASIAAIEPHRDQDFRMGAVYIAPPDKHMLFEGQRIVLDQGDKQNFTRPAIDPLFFSAAKTFGPRVVGMVLTGGGSDGTQGLNEIWRCGGLGIVQTPSSARQAPMPQNAVSCDHVCATFELGQIGAILTRLVKGDAVPLEDENTQNAGAFCD